MSTDDPCFTILERDEVIGMTLMAEAGLLSMTADAVVLAVIMHKVIKKKFVRFHIQRPWRLFKTPLDLYILSIIVGDLIQGFGSASNIRWLSTGTVSCSAFCDAQGVAQIVGEASSAIATLAITVYTTLHIVFVNQQRRLSKLWIHATIIGVIWTYVVLYATIGLSIHHSRGDEFIRPTPFWCWISPAFRAAQLSSQYIWYWLAALASIVLYIPLFFLLRKLQRSFSEEEVSRRVMFEYRILLYPFSYIVLVLPLSVVRWSTFTSTRGPNNAATFTAITLFHLTGLVNVILFFWMRKGEGIGVRLLADEDEDDFEDQGEGKEISGTSALEKNGVMRRSKAATSKEEDDGALPA